MFFIINLIQVFSALADNNRYKIINELLKRDYCVGGLARELNISEAAVSQHLKILREAKLISGEKNGYYRHYRVNKDLMIEISKELVLLSETEREKNTLCPPKNKETCVLCRLGKLEKK